VRKKKCNAKGVLTRLKKQASHTALLSKKPHFYNPKTCNYLADCDKQKLKILGTTKLCGVFLTLAV
jgi:hypothetical protein